MRLHHLSVTAFGPFAGSEQVDLDALSSSGLFLIHGPTGAGKTSILDAICFALYAAVPGARAGARASLRSDHAADGVVPEVTLEFTAGRRRLRVCRSPEFSRAKKRGTGETTVPAKVVLEELVGSAWVVCGTRNDEVAMVLKDVLGMGLEQFIKVVLLPQGDFAAFLRASPEQRRSLLEKLFDTQRFTDVETWLAERRRQTATAADAARGKLSTGLLRVDDAMTRLDEGDDIVAPAWPEVPDQEIGAVLSGLTAAIDLRASTALAGVEAATTSAVQAESAVHHGSMGIRQQRTAADARAALGALDEQQGTYQNALQAVDLAERAGAVSGFVAAVESADLIRNAAAAGVAELREPLVPILGADADASFVRTLVDRLADRSDALQQVAVQARRAEALSEESAQHGEAARAKDQESVAFAQQRTQTEERRTAAEQAREAGRAALARIPVLEARHRRLTRIQQLVGDQEQSASNLETLQRQTDLADRLLLDTRGRLLDLRERRLAGMAAELANGLASGDPCPVCGSCSHPMPARATDVVSPQDIRSAETDQTRATEALSVVRSEMSAELARRDARALELAATEPTMLATDVPDAFAASIAALSAARAAAEALPEAEAQMVALSQDVERLRGLVESAVVARASSLTLADATRAQSHSAAVEVTKLLESHGQTCPCHTTDTEKTADEVRARHRQTLADLRSLATGIDELVTHEASARAAHLRLSTALQDHCFETMNHAKAAALPPARVAELTAQLRATEQQRAQATALLAQPDVTAALRLPTPDVDALAAAHTEATRALTAEARRHTLLEQAQRDLRALSGTVHQALAGLGPAEGEARLVQELADCVAGNSADNALRMRLSSYVLAARLAEIATLANERLGKMSDGRYSLEYTDARAANGARSGLGLLVRDAWTGRPRETSSLSGGEAFMASLALALGLGDAVRAEAGGLDLQTLFVDEGFGSLDEDSLEQVMAVLDTLREGGRAVGIVSHVTELRQRIPQQLQVFKQQAGSSLSVDSGVTST